MRVILSRKGFDSGYGRVPSPILPDGRMISLPIPDKDAPVAYGAIQRDGINLGDLVADLTGGEASRKYRAHLDPDLDPHAIPRPKGWRPIFGQAGAALGHLRKEGVGPGDLFLFFGWFRPVERVAGHWHYVRGSQSVHSLWGWMLIGAIHECRSLPGDVARWAAGHPHLSRAQQGTDDVIVAADELVIAGRHLPGAGVFRSRAERVLTEHGANRSVWRMPVWMHPDAGAATLSYHGDRKRWSSIDAKTCRLASVAKGQEFVLNSSRSDQLQEWLSDLFADVEDDEGGG
jgi:hypothetical protein